MRFIRQKPKKYCEKCFKNQYFEWENGDFSSKVGNQVGLKWGGNEVGGGIAIFEVGSGHHFTTRPRGHTLILL